MSEPLSAEERAENLRDLVKGARRYRGTLAKVTTSDWLVILATLDAERARLTPEDLEEQDGEHS